MRWIIVVGYTVAVLWLVFSLVTFLYNYAELKRLDSEIGRLRAEITVWKTDITVLKEGVRLESKDSTRTAKYNGKGGGTGEGKGGGEGR